MLNSCLFLFSTKYSFDIVCCHMCIVSLKSDNYVKNSVFDQLTHVLFLTIEWLDDPNHIKKYKKKSKEKHVFGNKLYTESHQHNRVYYWHLLDPYKRLSE